jgi:anti-sigma factor RsiW
LDGELDARNTAEVQAHLAGCPACQRQSEVQRTLASNVRRLDLAYAAPASLRQRIGAALEAEMAGAGAASEGTLSESAPRAPMWIEAAPNAPAPSGLARSERAPGELALGGLARSEVALGEGKALSDRKSVRSAQGSNRFSQWLMWAGWPVAVAASALLATVMLQQRALQTDDIVGAHVRSLLVDHLSDVVSTSHHTVKPWFAGKIDFTPPVPDLSSRGFELVGGRLDYVRGQSVAAVIYRKHGHIINVLAGLPGHGLDKLPQSGHVQGYSLRSWQQAGLDLVAISDIDPRELANLEEGYESPPPQTSD